MSDLSNFDVYTITIRIRVSNTLVRPEKWDWDTLLDLGQNEYAIVENEEFLGKASELDGEDEK